MSETSIQPASAMDALHAGMFDDNGASAPAFNPEDAGKGANISASDVILPNLMVLQPLSKPVQQGLPGAKPGALWLTTFDRPVTDPDAADSTSPREAPAKTASVVIVTMNWIQQHWRDINDTSEGPRVLCESIDGTMVAREPNGLTGATLDISLNKRKEVVSLDWEGGRPTDKCFQCVYGPAANAASCGQKNKDGNKNAWIAKRVEVDGNVVDVPQEHRAPKCTGGFQALALIAVPAFEGAPPDIIPAFVTFNRTDMSAGKRLSTQLAMSRGAPAWARIWGISSQGVSNDKGSWFVSKIQSKGWANRTLVEMASELYDASRAQTHRAADFEEYEAPAGASVDNGSGSSKDLGADVDMKTEEDAF